MANPTYIPGVGRLAADRYDFQHHVAGSDFYHNADAITVIPGLSFNDSINHTNVYSSLSAISEELAVIALSGKGFLQLGDGFDTYINSLDTPDTPYDASVPAFDGYLSDVLNNPANPLFFRIRDGGVVMIKAGTYKFTDTVDVPPGIILLGEGYGTKIVNQLPSPGPLFRIKADLSRIPDAGVDATEKFIFCKETMLINLTIADNFLEPKFLGDLSYRDPQNNDSTNPLVSLEEGGSLSCENVRFVGKTTYNLGVISDVTSFAIATDGTVPNSTGTRLKIFNCSIDGFATPIQFTPSFGTGIAGVNNNFIMTNTLIRGYGYLNSDFAAAANNSILKLNVCGINIANNYCFGYDSTVVALAYLIPGASLTPLQSKARVVIANNNMAVDRTSSSANTTFKFALFSGALNNTVNLLTYGNNFDNRGFTVAVDDDDPQLSQTDTTTTMASAQVVKTVSVSSSPYTVDNAGGDYVLLVSTAAARTINLPDATTSGRVLVIKDVTGSAATNNITLSRNGGTGSIEGVSANYAMNGDFQIVKMVSNSGNWVFIK